MVFVDNLSVGEESFDVQLGVDQGIATARFTIPLPLPLHVAPNAEVAIEIGHNNLSGQVFTGRIPSWDKAISIQGDIATVRAVGWASLLAYPDRFDLFYDGPITIAALFDSLCARRGVPSYRADAVTDVSGTVEIELGGNPHIDDGRVRIPAAQGYLSFLNNAVEPYGYRVYDTVEGVLLTRISGLPTELVTLQFAEGVNVFSCRRSYDTTTIRNYWRVIGQTYEDEQGATVPIESIPESVTGDPLVPVNDGIHYEEFRSSLITSQQQANFIRQRLEIDHSTPHILSRWEAPAVPGIMPGQAVTLHAPSVGASDFLWLMSMDITSSPRGLTATYEGWQGSGSSLPTGNSKVEIDIQASPIHLGNETLSHYAHPVPHDSVDWTWNITIDERATAVNVRGLHHGTNSQLIGGVNTDIEVTKWEVWLPGSDFDDDEQRPVRSGNMPIVDENLLEELDYDDLSNWAPFAINLRNLDAGNYVLRLVSGVKAGPDDFEVRDVILEVYGVVEPVVIPGESS